jgi:hypothetical protein
MRFADGSALVVATVADSGDDVFVKLVAESLAEREGAMFVGLRTTQLTNVEDIMKTRQIPFDEVTSLDGGTRTIFFPDFPRLRMFYFYETKPQIVQMPAVTHRNSAQGLEEAWIAVDDYYALEGDFASLGFPDTENALLQSFRATAKKIQFPSGSLHFVQREHLEDVDKQYLRADSNTLLGLSVRTTTIETTAQALKGKRKINYATTRYNGKSCLLFPPQTAFGSWLELARPMK